MKQTNVNTKEYRPNVDTIKFVAKINNIICVLTNVAIRPTSDAYFKIIQLYNMDTINFYWISLHFIC